jgi:hypothetical protein
VFAIEKRSEFESVKQTVFETASRSHLTSASAIDLACSTVIAKEFGSASGSRIATVTDCRSVFESGWEIASGSGSAFGSAIGWVFDSASDSASGTEIG